MPPGLVQSGKQMSETLRDALLRLIQTSPTEDKDLQAAIIKQLSSSRFRDVEADVAEAKKAPTKKQKAAAVDTGSDDNLTDLGGWTTE